MSKQLQIEHLPETTGYLQYRRNPQGYVAKIVELPNEYK